MPLDRALFPGQNWKGTNFDKSPIKGLLEDCLTKTNWNALIERASVLNEGRTCKLLPDITNGFFNLVRVLEFDNQDRWIARIQLRHSTAASVTALQCEIDTMSLVAERTKIPVPMVFGYATSDEDPTGSAFILMEFLPGNVAIDADGGYEVHSGKIPQHNREGFYKQIAESQLDLTSVRSPKIGSIIRSKDGYDVGPLLGIGGPFETSSEFFEAWAEASTFPTPYNKIRKNMGSISITDEIVASITSFPHRLKSIARCIPISNNGPFPLTHTDLFHSNIIIDQDYKLLCIIDWAGACTLPWELVEFPPFLAILPVCMDAPSNYHVDSKHKDEDTQRIVQEQQRYVQEVALAEKSLGVDSQLSAYLANRKFQDLAYAVRVFPEGKLGFYSKVLDHFKGLPS